MRALAADVFATIRQLSSGDIGVTRESYGQGESAAIAKLSALARTEGIVVQDDRAGNVMFSLSADDSGKALWCGSHLDSVPQGGNYDGLAGVVAGLLCLIQLKRNGIKLARPFKVAGFRGEESAWFGKAYMGTGALFGKLTSEDLELKNRSSGKTLAESMHAVGADVEAIRSGVPLINLDQIAGYLELHIEQGPVMVARGFPTAVVSGIRGNVRHNTIRCIGEPGHSGAVPRWLRRDAVFAVADLIMRMDEHWKVMLERGNDLVITCGVISTDPAQHSISRIPGEVSFSFEARSQSRQTLEDAYQLMRSGCEAIARERHVRFEFDRRLTSEPAVMDKGWCKQLLEISEQLGLPVERLPSGAGHDASLFANAGIPAGMIFIRNEHGSHNPDEAMDIDDFCLGLDLLYQAILELS